MYLNIYYVKGHVECFMDVKPDIVTLCLWHLSPICPFSFNFVTICPTEDFNSYVVKFIITLM